MKPISLSMAAIALLLGISFSSCKKDNISKTPDPPPTDTTKSPVNDTVNTVTGTITDMQGKPLAGVHVRAVNPSGDNIFVEGYTNHDGKYLLKLSSIGGWQIYAWETVDFKGRTYHNRLAFKKDADYGSFSTNGGTVVKDFIWKLRGNIPDRDQDPFNGTGYFGGSVSLINLNDFASQMAPGTNLTVKFIPVGDAVYLDGTKAGKTIEEKVTIQEGTQQQYYFVDLPVTEYRIYATSELNGVTRAVYIGLSTADQDVYQDLIFEPASNQESYDCATVNPNDRPFYMGYTHD